MSEVPVCIEQPSAESISQQLKERGFQLEEFDEGFRLLWRGSLTQEQFGLIEGAVVGYLFPNVVTDELKGDYRIAVFLQETQADVVPSDGRDHEDRRVNLIRRRASQSNVLTFSSRYCLEDGDLKPHEARELKRSFLDVVQKNLEEPIKPLTEKGK